VIVRPGLVGLEPMAAISCFARRVRDRRGQLGYGGGYTGRNVACSRVGGPSDDPIGNPSRTLD
jgi:hypothetical protein